MEPIGREVGANGRAVEGLALEVKGLAARVVVTWVVVRGPEVTRQREERGSYENETLSEKKTSREDARDLLESSKAQQQKKKKEEEKKIKRVKDTCMWM